MEKSLKLYLSSILVLLLFQSCQTSYDYYKKAIDKEDFKALSEQLQRGSGNYYQGDPANMILLRTALQYNDSSALVHREIGVPYLKRGFPVEFSKYYAESANLNPKDWQGWRGYLYLYFYRDYERALIDFDATDIHTPDFVDYPQSLSVDYMRAICYYYLEQPKKAIAYITKHIKLEQSTVGEKYIDSKSYVLYGKALQDLGKEDEALKKFEKALSLDANVASIYYHLSDASINLKQYVNASTYLEKAQSSLDRDIIYSRNYMDEFFRVYQEDIDVLREKLRKK